jgi:nucleotide-binding universal stress UspA family protein
VSRRRILLAVNRTVGDALLSATADCARELDASVLLVHVLPRSDPRLEASARAYLDTLVAHLGSASVDATAAVRIGNVVATLLAEARGVWAAVIVLGVSRRPVVVSSVLGSISSAVGRGASCPVVLVHRGPGSDEPRPPLWSFGKAAERCGPLVPSLPRIETVEVARIVGSVGRARELGVDFRPPRQKRRLGDEQRLQRVRDALDAGKGLPPVELYKLGSGYYVLDGHHRVAAALQIGQAEIDANVVEYVPTSSVLARKLAAAS